ncbi:MAG: translation initiation factor IF-2 [Patescibacteria group bacterium]|mgnify:FL=1
MMPKKLKKLPVKKNDLASRPPVITVMGHIDHGKTTLLDSLRQAHVADKESGGITQHIGAYQVDFDGRKLTFIDTPGHAAFSAMRSRGVQATDLVILVIDVLESVKPQTKECLELIKASGLPFIVALNKMDLPNATPVIVKKDLADAGFFVEGYGGDIVCCEISAKTKTGLPELLEMIVLMADMQNLKSEPNAPLEAVVIESYLDPARGPVATVIVKKGTLKLGDTLNLGGAIGKIKALYNEKGSQLTSVLPGCPALVLGFKTVPLVGASNLVTVPIDATHATHLKLILKADMTGTLEAIIQNLGPDVALISSGIGDINESDVALAQSTGAKIIGFRVKTNSSALRLSGIESIIIKNYTLIHELLDDLQKQILKILEPTIDEETLGEAKIIAEFKAKDSRIAGIEVISGKLCQGDMVHLLRNNVRLVDAKIKSIHEGKEIVDKAKAKKQYGLTFTSALAFQPKDTLQAFKLL